MMDVKARLVGTISLLAWALTVVASPVQAQETPAEGAGDMAAKASEPTADQVGSESNGILPARITTGYPERALREGLTGTVGLTVTITPEGKATDCVVTRSSGHAELDYAACKEIQEKARFSPALDADGKPTSAQFSTKITFRIN